MAKKSRSSKKPYQQSFKNVAFQGKLAFGGALLKKAKGRGKRPFCSKSAIHLVFKSSKATGALCLLRHDAKIRARLKQQAQYWGLKIYSYANAGNHIHLLVRVRSPRAFRGFLRSFSGLVSRAVLGAEKSKSSGLAGKFWDYKPYSRILQSWTRDFKNVKAYLCLNRLEGQGWIQAGMSSSQRRKLSAWLRLQLWPL